MDRLLRCRLQLLLDPRELGRDLVPRLREMVAGGVDLVQLRMKQATTAERVAAARLVLETQGAVPLPLLINDDVAAAAALGGAVAGVHLGQHDTPIAAAREQLGAAAWIGQSTHSCAELVAGQATSATHFGLGACFPTTTKRDHQVLGRTELAAAIAVARRPLFAIGGITLANIAELVALGIRRIAVSSALLAAADPGAAAAAFRAALDRAPHGDGIA